MTNQNQRDEVKVELREKFKAIQAYLKKQEKNQINTLKQLEKSWKKEKTVKEQNKASKLVGGEKLQLIWEN